MYRTKANKFPNFPRTKIHTSKVEEMGRELSELLERYDVLAKPRVYGEHLTFQTEFEKLIALDNLHNLLNHFTNLSKLDRIATSIETSKFLLTDYDKELIYDIVSLTDTGIVSMSDMQHQLNFIHRTFDDFISRTTSVNPFLLALTIFHSKNACRKTPNAMPVDDRKPLHQSNMKCLSGEGCRYFHSGKVCLRKTLFENCTSQSVFDTNDHYAYKYNSLMDEDDYFYDNCKFTHDCLVCHLSRRIANATLFLPTCDRRNPDEASFIAKVEEKRRLVNTYDSAIGAYRSHYETCIQNSGSKHCRWCDNNGDSMWLEHYAKQFTIEFLTGIEKEEDYDYNALYGSVKNISAQEFNSDAYAAEKEFTKINGYYGYSNYVYGSTSKDEKTYRVLNLDFYKHHNLFFDLSEVSFDFTQYPEYVKLIVKVRDNTFLPNLAIPGKHIVRCFREDYRKNGDCARVLAVRKFYKNIGKCFDIEYKLYMITAHIKTILHYLNDDDFIDEITTDQKKVIDDIGLRYKRDNDYPVEKRKDDNLNLFGKIRSYLMVTPEFRTYHFDKYRYDPLPRAFVRGENIEASGGLWDRKADVFAAEERKLKAKRDAEEYERLRQERETRQKREMEELAQARYERQLAFEKELYTRIPPVRKIEAVQIPSEVIATERWPALKGKGLQASCSSGPSTSYAQAALKPPARIHKSPFMEKLPQVREEFPALKPQRKRQ
jgi:hypothetical protein